MATKDDRRAAVLLLALALAGMLVRIVTGDTAAPGAVAYRPVAGRRPMRDSVAERARRLARPLAKGETIDVDAATAQELVRLPRIGAGLAARIVAEREAHGPFRSLDGLRRVPGVGGSTLEGLRSHVRFAAGRAPPARRAAADRRIRVNRASAEELERLPGIGPVLAKAIVADRARRGPFRRIEDLRRVRGIGAATVERLKRRIIVP